MFMNCGWRSSSNSETIRPGRPAFRAVGGDNGTRFACGTLHTADFKLCAAQVKPTRASHSLLLTCRQDCTCRQHPSTTCWTFKGSVQKSKSYNSSRFSQHTSWLTTFPKLCCKWPGGRPGLVLEELSGHLVGSSRGIRRLLQQASVRTARGSRTMPPVRSSKAWSVSEHPFMQCTSTTGLNVESPQSVQRKTTTILHMLTRVLPMPGWVVSCRWRYPERHRSTRSPLAQRMLLLAPWEGNLVAFVGTADHKILISTTTMDVSFQLCVLGGGFLARREGNLSATSTQGHRPCPSAGTPRLEHSMRAACPNCASAWSCT